MDYIDVIGLSAAILTTIAFVPQLVKIVRSRQANDISYKMYLIFIIGISLWLTYGIFRNDISIILANSITLVLASCILFLKIKYERQKETID